MNRIQAFTLCILSLLILLSQLGIHGKTVFSNLDSHETNKIHDNVEINQEKMNHTYLEISSNEQLALIADEEGWSGDGSELNPYIIENYAFYDNSNDTTIFNETISDFYYPYGGFTVFNLILQNTDRYVTLKNNDFQYSMLVFNSSNVEIVGNRWVNATYSSNLFVYHDLSESEIKIVDNLFNGNNEYCEDNKNVKPTPRVYARGDGIKIIHNVFEMDLGCHEIIQLTVAPTNGDDDAPPMEISYNWFKASDTAIENHLFGIEIKNNDFEVGDFGIVTNGGTAKLQNNNFMSSQIGVQDQQNYSEPLRYISQFRYERGEEQPGVQVCQLEVDANYYSSWSSPDDNFDGIVDNPYNVCPESFQYRYVYDSSPSTTPFSGYLGYDPNAVTASENEYATTSNSNSIQSTKQSESVGLSGILPLLGILVAVSSRKMRRLQLKITHDI